jgi:hypothetical protein
MRLLNTCAKIKIKVNMLKSLKSLVLFVEIIIHHKTAKYLPKSN